MESFAFIALVLVGLVVFNNHRAGTLNRWVGAKFANTAAPRDAARSATSSTSAVALTPAATTAGFGSTGASRLLAPVTGPITSRFGEPRGLGRTHAGVDFGVPESTPVAAARTGRVSFAGSSAGYGLRVDVDHGDGVSTRYGHLVRITVRAGEQVRGGQTIGYSGNTGESTGPHLHFEVREHGDPVNPESRLGLAFTGGVLQ